MNDELESCSNCGAAVDKEPSVLCDDCDRPIGMGASDAADLLQALKDLCKYAVEDRAVTPGTTRLARGVIRAQALIDKMECGHD